MAVAYAASTSTLRLSWKILVQTYFHNGTIVLSLNDTLGGGVIIENFYFQFVLIAIVMAAALVGRCPLTRLPEYKKVQRCVKSWQ